MKSRATSRLSWTLRPRFARTRNFAPRSPASAARRRWKFWPADGPLLNAGHSQFLDPSNPSWDRVQLARHPKRPALARLHPASFHRIFMSCTATARFGDDHAIVAGMARFDAKPVMVIAQEKGRDTKQKILRNCGMPRAGGLSQSDAPDGVGCEILTARSSPCWTRQAPSPAKTPKSAARPKRSPRICARCRAWACR